MILYIVPPCIFEAQGIININLLIPWKVPGNEKKVSLHLGNWYS